MMSRHYGFAIHPCTPYRPNEKGRVERVIRDIRSFLYTQHPKDLADQSFGRSVAKDSHQYAAQYDRQIAVGCFIRRAAEKLPAIAHHAKRVVVTFASKTGFVEVDSNRYSVPSRYTATV